MKAMFTLCYALLLAGVMQAQETFMLNIKLKHPGDSASSLMPAGDGGGFITGAGQKDCSSCRNRVFAQHYNLLWAKTYGASPSALRPQTVASGDGGFVFLPGC